MRKLARLICSYKVLLNLANLKTKNAGDGYAKKAIGKTVIRLIGTQRTLEARWIADAFDSRRTFRKMTRLGHPILEILPNLEATGRFLDFAKIL